MDDVQVLAMISEPYKLLRHGFIISYKRNKLHMITESDEKYIIGGDFVSHRGDAKVDAELYRLTDGKARDDFLVFQSLYGCHRLCGKSVSSPYYLKNYNRTMC